MAVASFCFVFPFFGYAQEGETTHAWDSFLQIMGGRLPDRPEDWVDRVASSELKFKTAVIPEGRSLERRATSIDQPRSLIALVLKKEFGFKKRQQRLFLAYVPKLQQFQMLIPTNDGTRFSFEIIQRSLGGAWVRKPVDQGLCLGCHQSGMAIFSVGPWAETQSNAKIRHEMIQSKNLDPVAFRIMTKTITSNDPESFEEIVKTANDKLIHQRSCRYICEGDSSCAKTMSLAAQNHLMFAAQSMQMQVPTELRSKWIGEMAQTLESKFGQGSAKTYNWMAAADFGLLDRDPRKSDTTLQAKFDPLLPRETKFPLSFKANDYKGQAHWLLSRAQYCVDDRENSEYQLADLTHWMKSPSVELKAQMGSSIRGPVELPEALSVDEIFDSKCVRCHTGDTAVGKLIPSLPFQDLKLMSSYPADFGRTMDSVIRNGSMPPPGAAPLSEAEKWTLLRALAASK